MTSSAIVSAAAARCNISPQMLLSDRRDYGIVRARWAAMLLMRMHLSMSTSAIARTLHKKHHTTAAYGLSKAAAMYHEDDEFRAVILASESAADLNSSHDVARCHSCGHPLPGVIA